MTTLSPCGDEVIFIDQEINKKIYGFFIRKQAKMCTQTFLHLLGEP